jgi:hypothetical protein
LALAVCWASIASAPRPAAGQMRAFQKAPGKLEMRLRSSHPTIRSGAPFAIELEFDSTFPDVIQGPLELVFTDDDQVATRLVTAPVAIAPDKTTLQIPLPAMTCVRNPTLFQVHVTLNSTRRTFELGKHDLLVPLRGSRQFVIGAPGLNEVDVGELVRHLLLDEYRPAKLHRQNLATFPVELDAHRIMADPIELYAYDVLVFVGEHFSSLTAKQLDTLATWAESGGGLVIVPSGVLGEPHRQLLVKLAGGDTTSLQTDTLGRLPRLAPGHADWLYATRYGFGRALILRSIPRFAATGPPTSISKEQWIRGVTLLWNVQSKQVQTILNSGNWEMPQAPEVLRRDGNQIFASRDLRFASYADPGGLKSEAPAAADSLCDMLFPADVRVVPFGIVAGILALFLVVVAPGDYCILGWLRRRRYTWIAFPTVSLVFTAVTVYIAGYYSGNTDHRDSLVIVDVGEGGRALRTTRITHVITADTRHLDADIRDGLFALTDVQPAIDPAPLHPEDEPEFRKRIAEISYSGLVPSAYRVSWPSRQWTPAIHRLTQVGSDVDLPPIDWAGIDKLDFGSPTGRAAAIEEIRRAVPKCALFFTNGVTEEPTPFPADSDKNIQRFASWPQVLAGLARRRDAGLMAIVFALSPSGAGDLEDLAVLDDGDSTTWLVHVGVPRDGELLVLRHVVRTRVGHKLTGAKPQP